MPRNIVSVWGASGDYLPVVAGGSIDIGESSEGASGGTTATTAAVTTQATGSTFVVGYVSVSVCATPTDSKSNTYVAIGSEVTHGGAAIHLYYCENGTGGSGHTATVATCGSFTTIFFVEITGGLTSGILDSGASADASDSATPFDVTSGTTAQAVELLIAMFGSNGTGTAAVAVSGPFTMVQDEENGASFSKGGIAYQITSGTGAFTASFTDSDASACPLKIAAFKSA